MDGEWVERVFRTTEEKQKHMKDEVIRPLHFNVVLSEFRNNLDALPIGNTSMALSALLEKLGKVSDKGRGFAFEFSKPTFEFSKPTFEFSSPTFEFQTYFRIFKTYFRIFKTYF